LLHLTLYREVSPRVYEYKYLGTILNDALSTREYVSDARRAISNTV
jgi:hypothetical protein